MGIIKAKDLVHEYIRRDEEGNVESIQTALDKVSLDVKKGDFIAVLGHNGSGKSTLAKHINAILEPTEGSLWVDGFDTTDEKNIWDIRQRAGMVFQNPDNQIIASVVEEDVGFGPENIGVPTDEIWQRVEESLKAVGMLKYREHSPKSLKSIHHSYLISFKYNPFPAAVGPARLRSRLSNTVLTCETGKRPLPIFNKVPTIFLTCL